MPTSEAEKRQWLVNFQANLPRFAQTLNLDAADVQRIDGQLSQSIQNIDSVYTKNVELDEMIEMRNEHRNIFFPELSEFVRRAKTSKYYSKALGESMGVETYVSIKIDKTIADRSKLTVKINVSRQRVELKLKRPSGHAVKVFCRRGDETDFNLLTVSSTADYVDTRSNLQNAVTEKREYYFVLTKKDKDGEQSNMYAVAVLM